MEPLPAIRDYEPTFTSYARRHRRSEGLDSGLNREWAVVERHMNRLMDAYSLVLKGIEAEVPQEVTPAPITQAMPREIAEEMTQYD